MQLITTGLESRSFLPLMKNKNFCLLIWDNFIYDRETTNIANRKKSGKLNSPEFLKGFRSRASAQKRKQGKPLGVYVLVVVNDLYAILSYILSVMKAF